VGFSRENRSVEEKGQGKLLAGTKLFEVDLLIAEGFVAQEGRNTMEEILYKQKSKFLWRGFVLYAMLQYRCR